MGPRISSPLFAADIIDLRDTPGSDLVHWDLRDLYRTQEDAESEMPVLVELAQSFGEKHRGRISKLKARGISNVLKEMEQIYDRLGRLYTYAYLTWSTDTSDPDTVHFAECEGELFQGGPRATIFRYRMGKNTIENLPRLSCQILL